MQCKATTKKDLRCKNQAVPGSDYCAIHQESDSSSLIAPAIGGALLGNFLIPGIIGILAGGALGALAGAKAKTKSKKGGQGDS
uniref:Uncharacterized protein n=1 Tax=Candidatus Kentrum sp. MB TaxID=2138164 RepID=A0A451BEK4_9GAMM|nr:MAG: hypothetical protein BECKMB1821G_GA0114241_106518 [Candidatus Kentron sp. MB]VFK34405.1 MAG: hypothetical protein BECKMB1821I_GA0114274_10714 [Candidatus Kentron sp. MB]VFK76714.1 MAG: hypothetical protein BECKMB1821H_GA0114242_107018 [Candidatus Kentron sp. MB]